MGARASRSVVGRTGASLSRQREAASALRMLEREASGEVPLGEVLRRHGARSLAELEAHRLEGAAEIRSVARGLAEANEPQGAVELWRRLEGDEARCEEARCLAELGRRDEAATLLRGLGGEHPHALYTLALLTTEDRSERLRLFVRAAKRGSRPAIKNAANAFASGDGCEAGQESDAKALRLYSVAGELGDADAAFQAGSFSCAGRGLPNPDWDAGFAHHARAAQAGLPKAVFNLATHYFAGKGVTQDFAKAADLFEQAAPDLPQAMLNLANMLDAGLGRRKDPAAAAELRDRATKLLETHDDDATHHHHHHHYQGGGGGAQDAEGFIAPERISREQKPA